MTENVEERVFDSSPGQCTSTQCSVYEDVSLKTQDPSNLTSSVLASSGTMQVFPVSQSEIYIERNLV